MKCLVHAVRVLEGCLHSEACFDWSTSERAGGALLHSRNRTGLPDNWGETAHPHLRHPFQHCLALCADHRRDGEDAAKRWNGWGCLRWKEDKMPENTRHGH